MNSNWVCFNCRIAERSCTHKCKCCGRPLKCIGYKLRVPKANKVKKWKLLQKLIEHREADQARRSYMNRIRNHD